MIDLSTLVDDLDKLSPEALLDRRSDLIVVVQALERLRDSPGWGYLVQLLNSNAEALRNQIVAAEVFSELGTAFLDQHRKGFVRGLTRVQPLLSESITHYLAFRDLLSTALDKESSNGSSTESDRAAFARRDPDLSVDDLSPGFAP